MPLSQGSELLSDPPENLGISTFAGYAIEVLTEVGITREQLPPEEQKLYDLTSETVEAGLQRISENFEHTKGLTGYRYLTYHNSEHTKRVITRTARILRAFDESPSTIMIGMMEAAWHDVVQQFVKADGKRRRNSGDNEMMSARALAEYLATTKVSLSPQLQEQLSESALIADIKATVPAYDAQNARLIQPYLRRDSSIQAKALALADLGTVGMDPIESIVGDCWAVFFEEFIDYFVQVTSDRVITLAEEQTMRRVMEAWLDSQLIFLEDRQKVFESEYPDILTQEQYQALGALYDNFSPSGFAAIKAQFMAHVEAMKNLPSVRAMIELANPDYVRTHAEQLRYISTIQSRRKEFLSHQAMLTRILALKCGEHPYITHASTAMAAHLSRLTDLTGFAEYLGAKKMVNGQPREEGLAELLRPPTDNDLITTKAGYESLNDFLVETNRTGPIDLPELHLSLYVERIDYKAAATERGLQALEAIIVINPGNVRLEIDVWTGLEIDPENGDALLYLDKRPTATGVPADPIPARIESILVPSAERDGVRNIPVFSLSTIRNIYIPVWRNEVRTRDRGARELIEYIRAPLGPGKSRHDRVALTRNLERWLDDATGENPEQARLQFIESILTEAKLTSLHQHFEGTFSVQHLYELAQELGVNFSDALWNRIAWMMSHHPDEQQNIESFIQMLSTRWMRLIMMRAILDGKDGHEVLKTFARKIRELGVIDHMQHIELLMSVFAFTSEGSLTAVAMSPSADATEEELFTYHEWSERQKNADWDSSRIPTFFSSCIAIHEVAQEQNLGATLSMRVCIRREQDTMFTNDHFDPDGTLADDILKLYQNKQLAGFDIAGPEHRAPLSDFDSFFRFLQAHEIPFTAHAGEMGRKNEEEKLQAYNNLAFAINSGVRRIGHAVRLFDADEPRALELLEQLLNHEPPIYIEMNLRSNIWTNVTYPNPRQHPIIRALRREHPLFAATTKGNRLYKKFRRILVICHDDPHVVDSEFDDRNLTREQLEVISAAFEDDDGNVNPAIIREFLYEQHKNGESARLDTPQRNLRLGEKFPGIFRRWWS